MQRFLKLDKFIQFCCDNDIALDSVSDAVGIPHGQNETGDGALVNEILKFIKDYELNQKCSCEQFFDAYKHITQTLLDGVPLENDSSFINRVLAALCTIRDQLEPNSDTDPCTAR